jgi:hypothetical protein
LAFFNGKFKRYIKIKDMKTLEKIKEYSWIILTVFILLILMKQCSTNRDIDRMEKSIKSINGKLDSLDFASKEEIKKEINEAMFNFLIYEDDFDKGKASLSDIKSKINQK